MVYLSKFFNVEDEVWSVDNKKRIDIIATHKLDLGKKYPIGIEVKTFENKRGIEVGRWILQAYRYSTKEFKGYGKCLIIVCPQISGNYFNEGNNMNKHDIFSEEGFDNNIGTFLGAFNIGELQKYKRNNDKYHRIVYKGSLLWDSRTNILRENNYTRLWKR